MAKAELFQKDLPKEERIFYYKSGEDDPIKTDEQEKGEKVGLPDNYEFIPKNIFVKAYAFFLYKGFKQFARFYARFYLHMKIVGREKLKKVKGGYVIYANHTNPYHDAFSPALVANRRIFTIVSPVNLKIPGIGKFLPLLGALPLGGTKEEKEKMNKAVDKRVKEQGKCLVVYPEAHVWPYYTGIREFPAGDKSFKYAARNDLPIFTMTTTYQKSKIKGQERPDMTVYVDGPFYADKTLTEDEKRAIMKGWAYQSMVKMSKKSTYEYFIYKKKEKE